MSTSQRMLRCRQLCENTTADLTCACLCTSSHGLGLKQGTLSSNLAAFEGELFVPPCKPSCRPSRVWGPEQHGGVAPRLWQAGFSAAVPPVAACTGVKCHQPPLLADLWPRAQHLCANQGALQTSHDVCKCACLSAALLNHWNKACFGADEGFRSLRVFRCTDLVCQHSPAPYLSSIVASGFAALLSATSTSYLCRCELISREPSNRLVVCGPQGPPPPSPIVVERFQQVISQLFQQVRRYDIENITVVCVF